MVLELNAISHLNHRAWQGTVLGKCCREGFPIKCREALEVDGYRDESTLGMAAINREREMP
jgi:hypothetical protein